MRFNEGLGQFIAGRHTIGFVLIGLCVPAVWLFDSTLAIVVWFMVGWVLAGWGCVLLHELAHALTARLLGFRVSHINVSPFSLAFTSRGPRLHWRRGAHGAAGFVFISGSMQPTARDVRAYTMVCLAGPLANLIAGAALWQATRDGGSWFLFALSVVSWWSLLMGAGNLIPLNLGRQFSDGAQIRFLLKGGDNARDFVATSAWVQPLFGDIPPGNWSEEVIQSAELALYRTQPLSRIQLAQALTAGAMLYLHHMDRGEADEAEHVLARAALLPRPDGKRLVNDPFDGIDVMQAIHLALRLRNGAAGRQCLNQIHPKSAIRRDSLFPGAEAATALADGHPAAALALAKRARKQIKRSATYCAADRLELSWWDEVIELAGSPATAAPAVRTLAPAPRPAIVTPQPLIAPTSLLARPTSDGLFAWDPGVASELRTVWIWRTTTIDTREQLLSA